jgi:hypothetical protein
MAKKKKAANNNLFLTITLLAIVIAGIAVFYQPASSLAQTYYKSINCPTPAAGRPNLQLIPCTPSGVVNQPTYAQQQTQSQPQTTPGTGTAATPQTSTGTQSGPVCTPDSTIGSGASCKCQSDLEPDAVCTVPNYNACAQNGGFPSVDSSGFQFGAGGFPIGYTAGGLGGSSSGSSTSSGPIQCIWLDTAPVPAKAGATNCSIECNSKPVLYFYSPKTVKINVTLDIPGYVTESIPTYPENGWQNVIVHPEGTKDGTLLYNNKTYNELYYEDATIKATPPQEGYVIKTADLAADLRKYTAKLGLNAPEQDEFLAYWVPRLTQLKAPYIFFTVFDQTQKEKVDHVIVSPAPQTTIAFLAYFKPLASSITVAPLQFPAVPKRQGFTLVEWGGTVENN